MVLVSPTFHFVDNRDLPIGDGYVSIESDLVDEFIAGGLTARWR